MDELLAKSPDERPTDALEVLRRDEQERRALICSEGAKSLRDFVSAPLPEHLSKHQFRMAKLLADHVSPTKRAAGDVANIEIAVPSSASERREGWLIAFGTAVLLGGGAAMAGVLGSSEVDPRDAETVSTAAALDVSDAAIDSSSASDAASASVDAEVSTDASVSNQPHPRRPRQPRSMNMRELWEW